MIVFVLAGGRSTRMHSGISKIMLPLGGRRAIDYVLETAKAIGDVVMVVSPELEAHDWPEDVHVAVQKEAKGTGDAFAIALETAKTVFPDLLTRDIVTLLGDMPLLTLADLEPLLNGEAGGIRLLGMYPPEPGAYGRIMTEGAYATRIVEARCATEEERGVRLCNTAVMRLSAGLAMGFVSAMRPNDISGEYYMTDVIEWACKQQEKVPFFVAPFEACVGINTKTEWMEAQHLLQERFRKRAVAQGAFLVDASNTYFSYDTRVAKDVMIHPHVHFGPDVHVKEEVVIHPFCVLSHCVIERKAQVGPFAHLRDKVTLGEHSKIGNFVEVKGSTIGAYTQAKHLSYLGDAILEEDVTIGAGAITCNYDGHTKKCTTIRKGSMVGVNTSLIAPVTIGVCATVGAGSVITKDVPDGCLGVARMQQTVVPLSAESKHRNRRQKSLSS